MARKLTQCMMQKQGDVAVVSLLNKRMLDESNIQALYDELRFLVEQRGLNKMVLNFAGVDYLTSAVLGKLISLMKTVKENRGRLRICNVNQSVAEIFSLTQLDEVFGLDPGIDESIRAIKTGAKSPAKRGWWPWQK